MRERLDVLLVTRNLAPSREKAKALIMSGNVFIDNQKEDKPGTKVDEEAKIYIKTNPIPYVSRGGLKLEKALHNFDITLNEKICIDVGASTGGFTDCMLQNGAKKVFSIDVGYGQFDWGLRNHPKVVCMEKTNIRYVKPEDIGEEADFASIDVSFISLTKVIHPVMNLLKKDGEIISLVKPQFEAGREKVGKKGVVRDPKVHIEVLKRVASFFMDHQLDILDVDYSPITGPEGNIEYLYHVHKETKGFRENQVDQMIQAKVAEAHDTLSR